jgi:hypothetical protein
MFVETASLTGFDRILDDLKGAGVRYVLIGDRASARGCRTFHRRLILCRQCAGGDTWLPPSLRLVCWFPPLLVGARGRPCHMVERSRPHRSRRIVSPRLRRASRRFTGSAASSTPRERSGAEPIRPGAPAVDTTPSLATSTTRRRSKVARSACTSSSWRLAGCGSAPKTPLATSAAFSSGKFAVEIAWTLGGTWSPGSRLSGQLVY